jgi:hypothetical protein
MVLMAARWQHERQLLNSPQALMTGGTASGGRSRAAGRPLRFSRLSHSLYWMGLTASATLAAQSIATMIRVVRNG